jgi:hypothetical protein
LGRCGGTSTDDLTLVEGSLSSLNPVLKTLKDPIVVANLANAASKAAIKCVKTWIDGEADHWAIMVPSNGSLDSMAIYFAPQMLPSIIELIPFFDRSAQYTKMFVSMARDAMRVGAVERQSKADDVRRRMGREACPSAVLESFYAVEKVYPDNPQGLLAHVGRSFYTLPGCDRLRSGVVRRNATAQGHVRAIGVS